MKTLSANQLAQRIQFKWPINGAYSQGFGRDNTAKSMLPWYESFGLKGHNGLDIAAATGTVTYAPIRITITELQVDAQVGRGYGTHIKGMSDEISFQEGLSWSGKFKLELVFGHLKEFVGEIKVGDVIEAGTIIAHSDNTGFSTNPHLHFGVRPYYWNESGGWIADTGNGYSGYVDPMPFLKGFPLDLERIYRQYDGRLIKSTESVKVYLLKDKKKHWFRDEETLWSHNMFLWKDGEREIIKLAPFEINSIPEGEPMERGPYWDFLQDIKPELINYLRIK